MTPLFKRVPQDHALEQVRRLEFFQRLLERMLREIIVNEEGSTRHTLLLASLLRVRQSARAVRVLASEGCVEEILAIARSMVEVTVNAAYLQYASDPELQRFVQFHPEAIYQKRHQLQGGPSSGGGLTMMQRLSDMVMRHAPVNVNKDADPTWSQRTLMERARLADDAGDMPIMGLLVERCYPKSHAAAHGTMGSLGTFLSAVNERENPERAERHGDMTEALFTVNLTLMTTSLYLDGAFNLGMGEAIDEAATANSSSRPSLRGV